MIPCYQLSCGHWQNEQHLYGIGAPLGCLKCYSLRTYVIGFSVTAPGSVRLRMT